MIALLSPSKTLAWETPLATSAHTIPDFVGAATELVDVMRGFTSDKIARLMKISDNLALLNTERFDAWQPRHSPQNARPALLTFKGHVYTGLGAETFAGDDFAFAREHLRILSGLYGLLKPLDLIQPYRLEMGTRLATERGKTLYAFWGDRITQALNKTLSRQKRPALVNLASVEYFKAVDPKKISARVVTPVFKDFKNGQFKVISFYAKTARGRMASYLIRHRILDVEDLKSFCADGYRFDPVLSSQSRWVFTRRLADGDRGGQ